MTAPSSTFNSEGKENGVCLGDGETEKSFQTLSVRLQNIKVFLDNRRGFC